MPTRHVLKKCVWLMSKTNIRTEIDHPMKFFHHPPKLFHTLAPLDQVL